MGSQLRDPYDELPAKRVKGKERALPTASFPHPLPCFHKVTLMVVDQPPSPQHGNTEASSSRGTSSLGKHLRYKGYDMLDTNPDHDQEGMGRNICSYCFNDRSNESLTDDEMPDMRQVIKGGPSTAECAAAEAACSKAVASGVPPVTPALITWPTWPLEEDPTVQDHISACQEQGREINPQHWWCTVH
jgi:hypothetical protein